MSPSSSPPPSDQGPQLKGNVYHAYAYLCFGLLAGPENSQRMFQSFDARTQQQLLNSLEALGRLSLGLYKDLKPCQNIALIDPN